jgi:hypothetical protein
MSAVNSVQTRDREVALADLNEVKEEFEEKNNELTETLTELKERAEGDLDKHEK